MTSRLRCLVQATTQRTTTFHHSSGAARLHKPKASVDRYTAIRSFFSHNHKQPTQLDGDTLTRSLTEASWSSPSRNASYHDPRAFLPHISIRQLHTSPISRKSSSKPRSSSSHTNHDDSLSPPPSSSSQPDTPHAPPSPPPEKPPNLENYSEFFRRLALSLPDLHRPTKDDFLNVASGFWQRARIRFKWFTIKSFRKFNADDISAFITVLLMSQTLWVLVGTTAFFSVVFATINSLGLQEYVARGISDYLTSETGVTIIFESAIVPKWKDSRISFKNVYISRRPTSTSQPPSKGDISHRAAAGYDVANHPSFFHHEDDHEHEDEGNVAPESEDDVEGDGYSMFDLTIDSVDVTLSLWRWLDGKGLIEDAVVKGVRGVLDRRSVVFEPGLEPALFRHPARLGDFHLDFLQLEDVLITVHQPGDFRPFTASIFHANIGAFRKNFLFYDFLHAESVVGQFDGCLFSLHRPQSIGRTHEKDVREGDRSRMTRIRIDGVNIDHLQGSTTSASGPVSWITSGKVDAVLDITFPRDASAPALNEILGEIADSITSSLALDIVPGQRELAKPALSAPEDGSQHHNHGSTNDQGEGELRKERPVQPDPEQKVLVDIDIRFRDLKAAVPIFPGELSYVNSALIRPIVAFINANRVLVPIHCRVVKNLSDFEGAWTMWEAGLTDDISLQIYEALAHHVGQINMNRRIKTVSVWSLHLTANALLSALRNAMDPVTAHLRELYARDYESALRAGMTSFA